MLSSNSIKKVTSTKRALLEHNSIIRNLSTGIILSKGREVVSIPFFKINQLAIAILVVAPVFGAQAALISLDLSASALAATGEDPAINLVDGPSSVSVDAYADVFTALGHASGDSDGIFNSSANGSGSFESSATFLQSYTVTNDPFEQLFDFTFSIENGSLRVGCDDSYGGDGDGDSAATCVGTSAASYNAKIRLNGVSIWDSFAKLDFNGTNTDEDFEGAMLGSYFGGSDYFFGSEESYTLDLGSFSGGQMFNLEYEVTVTASGIGAAGLALFGDPNGFGQGGSPFNTAILPEPGSLGLIAAGLGLLGLSRRRKTSH
ncbi:MAG: hypothetical protein ACJAVI_002663 [Candidatus Azotimanducaceae bacterium]